uniref:FlgD/Vpr Ig-like domain-containing protein n=1 Tax=Eiseniibacteriota bacterium TaxID=2212470 RepID=A0A832MKJ3_UNCEI
MPARSALRSLPAAPRAARASAARAGLARAALAALACAALAPWAAPARAGVAVALAPADTAVAPGDTLTLRLVVPAAGSPFNGFEVTVEFDTAGLALVPLAPPAAQQGCLVTGACGPACGVTFHRFETAGDSAAATVVLLCDGVSLTGPGELYRLRFAASAVPQTAGVRVRRASFFDGGVFVAPVTAADAVVRIQVPVAVAEAPRTPRAALRAEPNPARGALALAVEPHAAGWQSLEAFDVTGRAVRRIEAGWRPAAPRRVAWDGRDDSGRALPPGVYLVVLRAGGAPAASVRVALVR